MKETKISVDLGGNIFKVVSRSILQKATTCKLPEGKRGEEGQSQFTFLFESDNPDCRGEFPPCLHFDLRNTLDLDFENTLGREWEFALGKVKMSPPVNLLSLSQWQDNPRLLREFC